MLIQTALQRPLVNMFALPENVVILTLSRVGTSTGSLHVSVDGDVTFEPIPPMRSIPFGVEGFQVLEYVVPFQDLAGLNGREGSRGFNFQARSAVRLNASSYVEQVTGLWVTFPQSGNGGIVRLNNIDFSNPYLNFRAEAPAIGSSEELRDALRTRISDENLAISFARVHAGGDRTWVHAARRATRLASFDLEEVERRNPIIGPSVPEPPILEETGFEKFERRVAEIKTRRDPLPRYMRDLGLDDE
jgi:hypothetical protein